MSLRELREIQALNTLVFETYGQPEKAREFKLKSLKSWGFDLLYGKMGGEKKYFTSEKARKVGEKYVENGVEYEVEKVVSKLTSKQKIFANIEMEEGRAYLVAELWEEEGNNEILRVPAASLLVALFKKNRYSNLLESIRNVGTTTEFIKKRGDEGKPLPYEELPGEVLKFLRKAKSIEKDAGFGRIALAYFGENKDRKPRFWISWLLPTIALFDLELSSKVNKCMDTWK